MEQQYNSFKELADSELCLALESESSGSEAVSPTIRGVFERIPLDAYRELKEKALRNFYDQKLKLHEMAQVIDAELERLDKALKNSNEEGAAGFILEEIASVKAQWEAWLVANNKSLLHWTRKEKRYLLRCEKRSVSHTGVSYTKEVQRFTAVEHAERGERYEKSTEIKIGNDPRIQFLNYQNPKEAVLDVRDVHILFHVVCGWGLGAYTAPGLNARVKRGKKGQCDLMVFLPRLDGDKPSGPNKAVHINLSSEFLVYQPGRYIKRGNQWVSLSDLKSSTSRVYTDRDGVQRLHRNGYRLLDFNATLKGIAREFENYYSLVVRREAGCDNDQVRLLHDVYQGDIVDFMQGGASLPKYEMGIYEQKALIEAFGKGCWHHKENAKGREKLNAFFCGDNAHRNTKAYHAEVSTTTLEMEDGDELYV